MEVIFIITLAFIAGSFTFLLFIDKKVIKNIRKPKNKVHFYVARNKNGSLYLYIGKPFRGFERFDSPIPGSSIYLNWSYVFKYLGLNKNDYINLKWEDEPIEVFINMKD